MKENSLSIAHTQQGRTLTGSRDSRNTSLGSVLIPFGPRSRVRAGTEFDIRVPTEVSAITHANIVCMSLCPYVCKREARGQNFASVALGCRLHFSRHEGLNFTFLVRDIPSKIAIWPNVLMEPQLRRSGTSSFSNLT